jgi:hypothetical protein
MRMGLLVDGQPYADQPVDPTNASCQVPFSSPVPCPLQTVRTLALDTATLPNGPHSVRVAIADAAGNRTVSEPQLVTTRNGGPPNGRGASRFARLNAWFVTAGERRAARVVSYGRSRSIAGRLINSEGRPIAGAGIDVLTRTRRAGAAWRPHGTVTTGEGRYVPLPPQRWALASHSLRVPRVHLRRGAGRIVRCDVERACGRGPRCHSPAGDSAGPHHVPRTSSRWAWPPWSPGSAVRRRAKRP